MLKGLVSKGVEPHVLVPDNKGVCQTLMNNHIVTHVLNYRAQVYPKANSCRNVILFLPRLIVNQMLNFRAGRLLKQIVREQKYDIIHTNVSVVNIGFKVAKKLKIKHLYHIREYGDLDFNLKYFPTKSTLLKILRGRHTFSAFITKDLQRYYGLQNSEMSRVIYNGIIGKVNQASEKQINDNDRFFLFAG